MAPVNAPFSCPNSSLSSSPVGMAAQFIFTNVRSLRRLRSWMARAISSLPVPVSPSSSTVESLGATVSTSSRAVANDVLEVHLAADFFFEVELFLGELVFELRNLVIYHRVLNRNGDLA